MELESAKKIEEEVIKRLDALASKATAQYLASDAFKEHAREALEIDEGYLEHLRAISHMPGGQRIITQSVSNNYCQIYIYELANWVSITSCATLIERAAAAAHMPKILHEKTKGLLIGHDIKWKISSTVGTICRNTTVYQVKKLIPNIETLSPTFAQELTNAGMPKRDRAPSAAMQEMAKLFKEPYIITLLGAAALDDGKTV